MTLDVEGIVRLKAEAFLPREAAQRLLLEINRQALVIAEQDEAEAVNNPDRPTRRVNLGVYLYAEDETPDAPKA